MQAQLSNSTNHPENISSLAYSPDGSLLASAGDHVRFWDAHNLTHLGELRGHQGGSVFLAFFPDGKTIASTHVSGHLRLWEVASRRQLVEITTLPGMFIAVSPNGKIIASAGADSRIKLWDIATMTEVASTRCKRLLNGVAFLPDGATLAVASGSILSLRSATTLEVKRELKGHRNEIVSLACSPDGKFLATASGIRELAVRVWSVETGEAIWHHKDCHRLNMYCVSFSPDGRLLASSGDYEAKIWNVLDGSETATLTIATGRPRVVGRITFSPDGSNLAVGGDFGALQLWKLGD